MGFLVAFEGIDGSGKGTQARRLLDHMIENGIRAELFSFPRYDDTMFGKVIGDFLNGRFGQLNEVDPQLVALLYAADRFESRQSLIDAMRQCDVVICDRYVPSNIAHQGAKQSSQDRKQLIEWIERIEYGVFELPRPDLVVLLDLSASEAQQLIALKDARNYTDKAADLQEADGGYLAKVRDVYREFADTQPNWSTVECCSDGTLQTIDAIAHQIRQVVEDARSGDSLQ